MQTIEPTTEVTSEDAMQQQEILTQERRHATGYARYPVEPGEFDGWENVRVWEQPCLENPA